MTQSPPEPPPTSVGERLEPTDGTAERKPRNTLRTAFWTFSGTLVLVTTTLTLGLLASVIGWLPPRGHVVYFLARVWSDLWLWSSGVQVEARYEQALEPGRGYVFMANHQSWYDIPALLVSLPGQVRFMAKKGLFQIPILGWALHAGGFIPVDRGDRSTARQSFAGAVRELHGGASVLLFPEETRSANGRLLPFKKGGFLVALRCGFPIVPIGLRGTREIRPKGSWLIQPGRVTVRYGRPIDVSTFGLRGRAALMDEVRQEIARLSDGGDG